MERLGDEEYPVGPRRSYTSRPAPIALPRGQRSQSETVATQLTDLETAERVLTRVSKTPPARRPTSAAATEAKAATATRGRGRPPKAATRKSAGREPNAPSLGERVLALATGKTRQGLYLECPNDRPNHIGIAVQRHLRAGRIQERDGKLYATSPAAQEIA
jgi:AT hook motif